MLSAGKFNLFKLEKFGPRCASPWRSTITGHTTNMSKHRLDEGSGSSLKHDKKRRKKDRKEAVKYEDITPTETDITTAESTPGPVQNGNEDSDSGRYKQSSSLTALPQAEVDSYLKSENVSITDSQNTTLRPILRFDQLPADILATYSPFFKNFEKPSSIQSSSWPHLLDSRDLIGIAETGSGKTLAFGLPLVHRLSLLKKKKGIRAVVVAPTRELAIQVFEQIQALTKTSTTPNLKATCIYGGTNKDEQRRNLSACNIIVATPGRLKDFMSDGTIDLSKTRYLVLDEADRMLDKGFEEDIKHIISTMPPATKRQTAMFTATWPKSIRDLAATFMQSPIRITIGRDTNHSGDPTDDGELRANPRIKQSVEVLDGYDKQARLLQLLQKQPKSERILVFCLYKKEATRIEDFIRRNRFPVAGIHGDLAQQARERSLNAFKDGDVHILVATDVAARGLDIPNVKLVINVTFPLTAEDYVHRIGRTGRAGKDGTAITFFTEQDKGLAGGLVNVLRGAGQPVPDELLRFGTTVKKKQHEAYGAFGPKEGMEGRKATKVTFDD
ncbi:RNA-dependent ATPase [Exophiala xenobiotica]|uniref:RNA helicase n=1 Tax=Lithohypha guttulata TaxID=1690604 RepID=A0ABR0KGW2_9EURO|nr:RNA-dependent ATPase [Lithohypha guttulata]KAK5327856.1 RNA-dependent ATPase [Exophiala xenobiotica]